MALDFRQPCIDISANVSVLFVSSVMVNKILSFPLLLFLQLCADDEKDSLITFAGFGKKTGSTGSGADSSTSSGTGQGNTPAATAASAMSSVSPAGGLDIVFYHQKSTPCLTFIFVITSAVMKQFS